MTLGALRGAAVVCALALAFFQPAGSQTVSTSSELSAPRPGPEAQGSDRWQRVAPGPLLRFPADHASHPPYKIEWWYYTGNVTSMDGRQFGYQLTFFRVGVVFEPATSSPWALRDLYMAHLAVTDIGRSAFRFADRMNRSAPWYAGADTTRYRVWNEDWEASLDHSGRHRLRASDRDIGIDLTLDPGRTPVVHGENGISQKGARTGNATRYYSLTRMPTQGSLTIAGEIVPVRGASWMDHEFGTSLLEPEQVGWDWFSLQLDDGSDLMLFQLRRRDGARDPRSAGTWLPPAGRPENIRNDDFHLESGGIWTSPASGAAYPLEWTVGIPARRLTLRVAAAVADQELDVRPSIGVAYWEGAITVAGMRNGRAISGRGYLELTGYAGKGMGTLLQ